MIKRANNTKTICILLVILISLLVIFPCSTCFCATKTTEDLASELNNTVIDELKEVDFTSLDKLIDNLNENNSNIFSIDSIKNKVYSIISGESAINYDNFFASMFSEIAEIILKYLPSLSLIIAIGVVSNLLNGFKSKFNEKSISNIINLVCLLSVAIIVICLIRNLTNSCQSSISNIVSQMNIIYPILITLMIGIGASSSASVMQPIVAMLSTYIADAFNYYIIPLFILTFVFGLLNNISDNVKLDKFSSFLHSLFKWSVGTIFTLFFAIMSIQGITAGSFDSISIRTTKYTIKSYIPIMGSYLSDGMDLILSSSVLIKNSLGLVGILVIMSNMLNPILNLIIFNLLLKLTSAVLEPLGSSKISNFLSSSSKSITILSTSIIAISFMYIISVGLIMSMANVVI